VAAAEPAGALRGLALGARRRCPACAGWLERARLRAEDGVDRGLVDAEARLAAAVRRVAGAGAVPSVPLTGSAAQRLPD